MMCSFRFSLRPARGRRFLRAFALGPLLSLFFLCPFAGAQDPASEEGEGAAANAIACDLPSCGDTLQHEPCFTGFKAVRLVAGHPDIRQLKKQRDGVLERHDSEKVFGPGTAFFTPPVRLQWKNLTAKMTTVQPDQKLRYINGFFNNWPSEKDMSIYGKEEYWATPEEFLEKGMGDCEDYALIKYMALRYFSWSTKDLWILLVQSNTDGRHHAVLAARDKNRIFILDNLSRPAYLLILEQQYLGNFTPLAALNEHGVWKFARIGQPPGNGKTKAAATARPR